MSEDKRGILAKFFFTVMLFCAVVWIWAVGIIMAWPWDKDGSWKPEFRVAAVCAENEICSIPYGQLAQAKEKGLYSTLAIPGDAGEVMEKDGWIQWKKVNDLIELKFSSWHFQTVIRYKLENEVPVLVEAQDVDSKALYYALAGAGLTLLGFWLRKFRK